MERKRSAIIGCLLGTAVGDAVGLPCEGLSRQRQARIYPDLDGPCLIGKRGMVSDDTEHACMTAQALLASGGDPTQFQRLLASRLRIWLLGVPAGVGLATLKAILKLWLGFGPERSGVFSAGNGPTMRSAILGVCYGGDPIRLRAFVRACTRLTHTDPKAEWGALAVALAAHNMAQEGKIDPGVFCDHLCEHLGAEAETEPAQELLALVRQAAESAIAGENTTTFAERLGLASGVGGYVYQTVPVALHAVFRNGTDVRNAVLDVVRCGGDTDTTGAIVGAIAGAGAGSKGIPADWECRLLEWPRTVGWMTRLGDTLANASASQTPVPGLFFPAVLARNLFFLLAILAHGFRRLLPPYA